MNKQTEILKYLKTVESATVQEITDNVPFGYYANGNKYIGLILSRMLKDKRVVRIKKGVYCLTRAAKDAVNTTQKNLFNH